MADVFEDLFLRDPEVGVVIFRMWADMDHAVHIKVQVVKFRKLKV